jgi:ABC-type sugar transport system ATPase subunit
MSLRLEVRHITKKFFGIKVLDDVSFTLRTGEVHTVVGENGAGKSTLMKILAGVYSKDEGEIYIDGEPARISNPLSAQRLGISMIFQELNLVPNLTVYENIYLGREETKSLFLTDRKIIGRAKELLARLRLDIRVNSIVRELKISERQMVEIAKALSWDAKIIIMDEPTSTLSDKEIETFFDIVKHLKSEIGISFIFISHRLREVSEISDRISVLRDGKYVGTVDLNEEKYNKDKIVNMMVGRSIESFYVRTRGQERAAEREQEIPVLEVRDFSRDRVFRDINLEVYAGEILGIAGLVGSGRTEILNAIVNIDPPETGELLLDGKRVHIRSIKEAIEYGIGYVPEDRRSLGLIVEMNILENSTLSVVDRLVRFNFIKKSEEKRLALRSIRELDIKTSGISQLVKYLSGGNQQKVVLAKSLNIDPKIMLLDEPTRGIDVNAKVEIYKIINRMVEEGMAVIMVSSELPEILGETDRIIAMHEGTITGRFSASDVHQEDVMHCMMGEIKNA